VRLGPIPTGYRRWTGRGVEGFAWESAGDRLARLWCEGPSVYEWAAGQPRAKELVGRGPVYAVPAPTPGPDGRERWTVRRYRRGGVASLFLHDRYLGLGVSRPMRELAASQHARAAGIRTPAVVAGAVYSTPGFYRADLVTELVPDARTLGNEVFHARAQSPARSEQALTCAGRLVRGLARAGMLHVDLNAGNVLLDRRDAAWVVDLDRCGIYSGREARLGTSMLRRLERSLRKLSTIHGAALTPSQWECLHTGFQEGP
jgi:3-deoxy-D-manno-octulosonic acid kinase